MNYRPLERLYKATFYSLSGLISAFQEEQAFRYEVVIFFILCFLALTLPISLSEAMLLPLNWLLVMAFELVNSAVEKAFDLIDKNYNPEIKVGKDMLSASVFLTIFLNAAYWIFLTIKYIFSAIV